MNWNLLFKMLCRSAFGGSAFFCSPDSSFSFHELPKEKEAKRKPTLDSYSQFEAMQNYRTSQQYKGYMNDLL